MANEKVELIKSNIISWTLFVINIWFLCWMVIMIYATNGAPIVLFFCFVELWNVTILGRLAFKNYTRKAEVVVKDEEIVAPTPPRKDLEEVE